MPLLFRGRALGVLAAFDRLRDGPEFSAWDEHVLGAFAASAAAAVATAQDVAVTTEWRRVEAQEQERRRWARELHDETLQELAALMLLAGAARRASTAEERTAALDQISEQADVAVQALRGLIADLRPAALDEMQLQVALEILAERTTRTHGLAVDLHVELAGEPNAPARLSAEIEDTIYRVVQEALSNVVKHAAADRADVHVVQMDATVEVAVRDDGAGFDPSADVPGFGLIGIRERAGLIVDATVQIESAPGVGTTIRVSLPIEHVIEPRSQVQAVAR